ncbi:MAG: hypothetical protein M1825_000263 [Sarcosagium campestre]|nr:MAG: hypothetical protein M1825_000263 [Sarcosagium campestre]
MLLIATSVAHFLASHNISANQIRQDYEIRRTVAEQDDEIPEAATGDENVQEPSPARAQPKKKNKAQENAIAKAKAKKQQKAGRPRKKLRRDPDSDDSDASAEDQYDSDDNGLWEGYKKSKPLPGQLDNCAICSKRFTVTPYSKAGPNGGLLCTPCSKEHGKEDKKQNTKKKAAVSRSNRRQIRSDMLDGQVRTGAKSLLRLSVLKIASSIDQIEDFGDMPRSALNQLSAILSKQRMLNSRTVRLFLRPDYDEVTLYDCAALATADYKRIFQVCPKIKTLRLEEANQFKKEVLEYITYHPDIWIVHFRVGGPNLIDDEVWRDFFRRKGETLETLLLTWIDGHLDDETVSIIVNHCPRLERIKFERLWLLTKKSIHELGKVKNLRHLTLEQNRTNKSVIESADFNDILTNTGSSLQTFCLTSYPYIDDSLLDQIHTHCRQLSKLRISENNNITDAGLTRLFTNWSNPPLTQLNLQFVRDVNSMAPDYQPDDSAGLAGPGFKAIMAHSGARLERLLITSCRHVDHAAFMHVFDGKKIYPALKFLCVSFCGHVDDVVLAGIFKSCPVLQQIRVFGCFNISSVGPVPRGVVLLGRPNAQDDMVIDGVGGD